MFINNTLTCGEFGAITFFVSNHPVESCGTNGLPLTANSIKVAGIFEKLKKLRHPNLCCYLDILRSQHEWHQFSLVDILNHHKDINLDSICFTYQIISGLNYLHNHLIVHRWLCPKHILFNEHNEVKLIHYGMYHMLGNGDFAKFPIGDPKYMAPEVLVNDWIMQRKSSFKSDMWSLGLLLLEYSLNCFLWKKLTLPELLTTVINYMKLNNNNVAESIITEHNLENRFQGISKDILYIINNSLVLQPSKRLRTDDLLVLPTFDKINKAACFNNNFLSDQLENLNYNEHACSKHPLDECEISEVYHLWRLAGGDPENELKQHGLITCRPPVMILPKIGILEGEMFGRDNDDPFLFDLTIIHLSQKQLRHYVKNISSEVFYPLVLSSTESTTILSASKLPLIIRERDVEYQIYRIILFRRLLQGYPYLESSIIKEAQTDIPPFYRAFVWAALLSIKNDFRSKYHQIDKDSVSVMDRQIEVDIPRCHQYDDLLSSPDGHRHLRRVLKAWVSSHPEYVYWQGLDSLCAPLIRQNFCDEALAFACLDAIVDRFLPGFFLQDNSAVVNEYLTIFKQVLAFHEPQLACHLRSINFSPELFAIPWFLTLFSHVLPLNKLVYIWDAMLLGNSSFPLFLGVAILHQFRSGLLDCGFNECILFFSDLSDFDIEQCVKDARHFAKLTPDSCTFRFHQNIYNKTSLEHLAFDIFQSMPCPRLSIEDLLSGIKHDEKNLLEIEYIILDIRSEFEFKKGAITGSLNAFSLPNEGLNITVNEHQILVILIVSKFVKRLQNGNCSHVCILQANGIDILRAQGLLIIP